TSSSRPSSRPSLSHGQSQHPRYPSPPGSPRSQTLNLPASSSSSPRSPPKRSSPLASSLPHRSSPLASSPHHRSSPLAPSPLVTSAALPPTPLDAGFPGSSAHPGPSARTTDAPSCDGGAPSTSERRPEATSTREPGREGWEGERLTTATSPTEIDERLRRMNELFWRSLAGSENRGSQRREAGRSSTAISREPSFRELDPYQVLAVLFEDLFPEQVPARPCDEGTAHVQVQAGFCDRSRTRVAVPPSILEFSVGLEL
ncbi:hypothetical protein C8J56DRAFT_983710, partial [Mycena floridula]